MRTQGAVVIVLTIGGAAYAQRHSEGIEASAYDSHIELVREQQQVTADMLENQREMRTGLLTDLYPSSADTHWEQQRAVDTAKVIEDGSQDIEVRHRDRRRFSDKQRELQDKAKGAGRSRQARELEKAAERGQERKAGRRVKPLSPKDLGKIRPGAGTIRIGSENLGIRFIPPGG